MSAEVGAPSEDKQEGALVHERVWVEEPSMGPVGPVPWVLMGTVVVSEGIIG